MAYVLLYLISMNSDSYSLNSGTLTGYVDRLAIITDNLANTATPGYRRAYATQRAFDNTLSKAINEKSASAMSLDFSQGPIRVTNRPLDFAINGKAFFVIEKDGGEYYTRSGRFNLAPDGRLVTTGNLNVQGEGGTITIPSGTPLASITVDSDGTIWAGEQNSLTTKNVGKVRLVEFEDTSRLNKVGATLFSAPPGIDGEAPADSTVSNRTLEGSNTSIFEEMAELIGCIRSYEACHKMFKSQDDVERKMINEFR